MDYWRYRGELRQILACINKEAKLAVDNTSEIDVDLFITFPEDAVEELAVTFKALNQFNHMMVARRTLKDLKQAKEHLDTLRELIKEEEEEEEE